jgi:hypothetical protein
MHFFVALPDPDLAPAMAKAMLAERAAGLDTFVQLREGTLKDTLEQNAGG